MEAPPRAPHGEVEGRTGSQLIGPDGAKSPSRSSCFRRRRSIPAIVDQPASIVAAYDGSIEKLPATIGLDVPAQPTQRIDPITSDPRLRWYLAIEISASGDLSVRCPGDWIEDYDRSPFFLTDSIAELPRELWVKQVTSADGGCVPLSR
jgi:hypothetical protein